MTVAFIRSMVMPRGGVRALGKPKSWSERVWEIYERVSGESRPEIFRDSETANPQAPEIDRSPMKFGK